jgi:ABC-2 type transport system ATP-binding protein
MAMIQVEDLRKNYGTFRALQGVDFSVDRGEILGFLGPNGAGKTTTMKILTGFLHPSGGRVLVAGHDVLEDPVEVRRRIGYLPEHTPLYEDLSVRGYLRYCGRLRRMGGARLRERVDAVIALTALGPKTNALIKTLSKGYRQRVGIAQALLHEPEIIILDEPTVGLDPNQVVDVRRLIRDIGRERTVILCSHILSEVEAMCARVLIIHEGRIVANGAPAELGRRLGRATVLVAEFAGPGPAGLRALVDLPVLSRVEEVAGSEGRGALRAETGGEAAEALAAIWERLQAAGLPVLRLGEERASLETVFRSLTWDAGRN